MAPSEIAALLAAGLAAGTVNAVAGGGSLITFPTLMAVGLPPVAANVTNSIAVSPGYLASVYGSREDLGKEVKGIVPTAIAGAVAGSALLLATPERAFELVVPFLVLGATAALAFQDKKPRAASHKGLHAVVGLGAIYGGYFGAALGVMMVAGLSRVLPENLTRISALKNAISAIVGVVTIAVFAAFGPVHWTAVAVLAPAALIGGYTGARVARRMNPRILRAVIVAVGGTVGVVLLLRALF